jgi:uncharacterized protein YndB with AHSA1/START domain/DNA-binding transcriptional ArsR family regulator
MDDVFKALASEHRRLLLDRLRGDNGQTLSELCANLGMTRQAVTKHLDVLEAANLVTTVWHGREKLHYLNPIPIQELYERWIANYERERLWALTHLKRQLEGNADAMSANGNKPDFQYTIYIAATPERVFEALTTPDMTEKFWFGRRLVANWAQGAKYESFLGSKLESFGEVVAYDPPRTLAISGQMAGQAPREPRPVTTFSIDMLGQATRLTVSVQNAAPEDFASPANNFRGIDTGWPLSLSSLKSLLETGKAVWSFQ